MLRVSVMLVSVLCVVFAAQSIGPLQPKPEKFRSYVKSIGIYEVTTTDRAGTCDLWDNTGISEVAGKVPGCYIKKLDKVIPFGQAAPDLNSCMEYRCSETFITSNTCGAVSADLRYKVVEDKTKLYPDCCVSIRRSPRISIY